MAHRDPIAHWKLDEAAGPLSHDASPNGSTGRWINQPTFSAVHPPRLPADPGCILLDGVDQYIDLCTPIALPTGRAARSLCGWGKARATAGGFRWIATYGMAGESSTMHIGMHGSELIGGASHDDLTVRNFWDDAWHFIVLTYDDSKANLYADGKPSHET